jgi:hypothetical protein
MYGLIIEDAFERGPVVVNYGAGVDSTAMLVELYMRGLRPEAILFADTGGEKPETYTYLAMFSAWLVERGFPPVTTVARRAVRVTYTTLEGNCLTNKTLPSLAFGRKSCSLKWKAEPMDSWLSKQPWYRVERAAGRLVTKLIGYDAGPKDSKRAVNRSEDEKHRYLYPLREWGWDREACVRQIARAGLPVPMKSACFFCPATQVEELRWLAAVHPALFERALAIEDAAQPNLREIDGLWRKPRLRDGRPGSWRGWGEKEGLVAPRTSPALPIIDQEATP